MDLRLEDGAGRALAQATVSVSADGLAWVQQAMAVIEGAVSLQFQVGLVPRQEAGRGAAERRELGGFLWRLFMAPGGELNEVGRWLRQAPAEQPGFVGGGLVIRSTDPRDDDLLLLPWDLAYDDEAGRYLAWDNELALVRCFPGGRVREPATPPLTLKPFLVAPSDLVPFNTLWFQQRIAGRWRQFYGPYLEFAPTSIAPTPQEFLDALRHYDVIYFVGHARGRYGSWDCPRGDGPLRPALWCRQCRYVHFIGLVAPEGHPHLPPDQEGQGETPLCPRCSQALSRKLVCAYCWHDAEIGPTQEPGLYLTAGESGTTFLRSEVLSAERLRAKCLEAATRTRLLVLSGCHSADTAAVILRGAEDCLRPVIVAMQLTWPIACALSFQEALLEDLMFRELDVARAVAHWRRRAGSSEADRELGISRENSLWAIPAVFSPRSAPAGRAGTADQIVTCFQEAPGGKRTVGLTAEQRDLLRELAATIGLSPMDQTMLAAGPVQHEDRPVTIGDLQVERHPVTVHLYEWFRATVDPAAPELENPNDPPDAPARVTLGAARRFCERMSAETGTSWRLPAWQEWEALARGPARGDSTPIYPWCADDAQALQQLLLGLATTKLCWVREAGAAAPASVFRGGAGQTGPEVADMIGNVPEFALVPEAGEGLALVAGWGWKKSLLLNAPSLWRVVHGKEAYAFRRVSGPLIG